MVWSITVLLPATDRVDEVVANSASPTFNTLVSALTTTGLLEAIVDDPGPFTLFAPTDDAFAALGDISGVSTEDLTDILLYHVAFGLFGTGDIDGLGLIPTLQGSLISVIGGDQFNPERVGLVDGFTDRRALNGVVHAIDQVLTIPA